MSENAVYLLSLMGLSVAAGMASRLAGEEKLGKYVRFAASLCVLVMLARPMETVLATLPEMLRSVSMGAKADEAPAQLPEELYNAQVKATADAITGQLEGEIRRRFGVETDIILELNTADYRSVEILGAVVSMNRADKVYRELIVSLIADTLGCRVEWEILD